jgi:CBS domain-containing protein
MRVGDICTRDVETAPWDQTALAAAQRMRDRDADAIVVVNDAGRPVGMLCDRDVVRGLVAEGRDAVRTPVADLMTTPTPVKECCAVETALRSMLTAACRRLPVIDETGALRGVIGIDDVVRVIAGDVELLGAVLARTSKQHAAWPVTARRGTRPHPLPRAARRRCRSMGGESCRR